MDVRVVTAAAGAAHRASSRWDEFFAQVVGPAVHVGTPLLVCFVVLVAASRVATRFAVGVDEQSPAEGWATRVAYWSGVGALAVASTFATVGLPSAQVHSTSAAGILQAVGAVWLVVLPLLFAPVLPRPARQVAVAVGGVAGVLLVIAAATGHGPVHWTTPGRVWAVAVCLALLGIAVVARVRGGRLGLTVDATGAGSDSAVTAQAVRVTFEALASQPPRNPTIVVGTDVETLPTDALALIPDGTLAKAAAMVAQLFTPATPWRLTVTQVDLSTTALLLTRNGRRVKAATASRAQLGLAEPAVATAGAAPTAADAATTALNAAAAFALVTLAKAHPTLREGLYGATDWRSVAAQVIATSPDNTLGAQGARTVLAYAVTFDHANLAALAAWVQRNPYDSGDPTDLVEHADDLYVVWSQLETSDRGDTALGKRTLFNIAVTWANYVVALDAGKTGPFDRDAARQRQHWAVTELDRRLTPAGGDTTPEVSLDDAFAHALTHLTTGTDTATRPEPDRRSAAHTLVADAPTMLVRYERACTNATLDRGQALTDLAIVTRYAAVRSTARQDTSLRPLRTGLVAAGDDAATARNVAHAKRFAGMVGEPPPVTSVFDLPALAPFADAIRRRGVDTAAELRAVLADPNWAERAFGSSVSTAVLRRWRGIVALEERLSSRQAAEPGVCEAGDDVAAVLGLLVGVGVGSVDDLDAATPADLHDRLLAAAAAQEVVVPSVQRLRYLQGAAAAGG